MALKAGRVGVAPSQVDMAGNVLPSGDSYTKAQADAKFATKESLTANDKEFTFAYDPTSQKYGYKAGTTGEFHPFEEAGIGWVPPEGPYSIAGITLESGWEITEGGYVIKGDRLYLDMLCHLTVNKTGNLWVATLDDSLLPVTSCGFTTLYGSDSEAGREKASNYFIWSGGNGTSIANTGSNKGKLIIYKSSGRAMK